LFDDDLEGIVDHLSRSAESETYHKHAHLHSRPFLPLTVCMGFRPRCGSVGFNNRRFGGSVKRSA
jgi:hypothetical protein